MGHRADRLADRVRHQRAPRTAHRSDAERRRAGRRQRSGDHELPSGLLWRIDTDRAVRRGSAEPEPDPRGRAGQRVLLVRLDLDALALVHGGESNMQDYVAPHALIARSCSASGTKFHDLDADGRARSAASPAFPAGSSGPTTTTTVLGTPASRSGSRMPKVTTSSTTSARRTGRTRSARRFRRNWGSVGRAGPASRAATRTTARPAAPAPRREACSTAAGGRSDPRPRPTLVSGFRQLRAGHPGGREAARAEQRPGPLRPARERPRRRRGCRGRRDPRFESPARRVHGLGGCRGRDEPGPLPINRRVQSWNEGNAGPLGQCLRGTQTPVRTAGCLHLPQRPTRLARDRDRQGGACQRDSWRHLAVSAGRQEPGRPSVSGSVRGSRRPQL